MPQIQRLHKGLHTEDNTTSPAAGAELPAGRMAALPTGAGARRRRARRGGGVGHQAGVAPCRLTPCCRPQTVAAVVAQHTVRHRH
jgi:hypothetical protein